MIVGRERKRQREGVREKGEERGEEWGKGRGERGESEEERRGNKDLTHFGLAKCLRRGGRLAWLDQLVL